MNPITADHLRTEIVALLRANPDLEDDDVLRADMIEAQTTAFEFISTCLRRIGEAQAIAHGTREYIAHLQERLERMQRREQLLRALILKIMQSADLKNLERPEATVSVRLGAAKTIITNLHELPDDFWRQPPREPDRLKIRAALQAHEYVPGAVLSNREPVLAIR